MKVSSEKVGNCQVSLKIEAEASELEKSLDEAYHRLVNRVSISGFRKGKAPRALLERHVGKDTLLSEALERLVPQLYQQAVEAEKIEPIALGQIELIQNEPLVFKAVVPLKPEVKLGEYHNIKAKPESVKIAKRDIEAAIENLRHEHAILLPVERPAQAGDFVTINIEASVEGKPFLNHKDLLYEVDSNSSFPLTGFATNLLGVKKKEEKIFSLEIPADYSIKEFCGKECPFKVMVTEIKEKQLPEVNDDFAQSCGYANLTQLREQMEAYLRDGAEGKSRRELEQKVIDAVAELSQVNYPPILEDREIGGFLRDEARRLGYREVEDYLKRINRTEEEVGQRLRPAAKMRVTNSLVLDKVAVEEKIEISSSEVDNRVEEILKKAEDKEKMRKFLAVSQVRQSIEQSLRQEKTIQRLVQIASGKQREGGRGGEVDK